MDWGTVLTLAGLFSVGFGYHLELFGGNLIFPVMKVHPKVLFSGILLENPYYLDPDEVPVGA